MWISFFYKSERLGEFNWTEPQISISHPDGVGEFSMTADGKRMAFAQLARTTDGGFRIDVYYSEKSGADSADTFDGCC